MDQFQIRDPVHGFIDFDARERKAIDTACMQRLRAIKQLAMTYLVYPGTQHTRFEHSLGVCDVADRLARALELGDDERAVVRIAALLHDVGHGPFSHVSENVLDDRNGLHGVHEAISIALIRTDPDLRGALGTELCDRAAALLEEGRRGERSAMNDIVSGPTDADKLDYLLRDSHYAGVRYGQFDLARLISTATVIHDGERQAYLGFDEGGVWAVEGLLLARHHMHRQVYGHKTRVATDIMIERAIMLGLEEGALDPVAYTVGSKAGQPVPDDLFLEAYATQTDQSVMEALLAQESETRSRELATRLQRRWLLRRNARIALHEHRERLGIAMRKLVSVTGDSLAELEGSIAREVGHPPHLVALRIEQPSNPTYRLPGADISAKDIMLSYKNRGPDYFQRESEIFREETGSEKSFASLYFPKTDGIDDDKAEALLWSALTSI
jgi:HD superfamily phosphohydrolase